MDEARIKRCIINVNHSGEFGAIRLYNVQLFIAQSLYPDLCETIMAIRDDENEHCELFESIMPRYNMVACRLRWIWAGAAYVMGLFSTITGKRGMMLCVKACEDSAHGHLKEQISYLEQRDSTLHDLIHYVDDQEQRHVELSMNTLESEPFSQWDNYRYRFFYALCQLTMWAATKGNSLRVRRYL